MIKITQKGDFSKFTKYLNDVKSASKVDKILDRVGQEGVKALSASTPVDTGKTASSWYYEIVRKNGSVSITFNNTNIQNGVPIAIILQYGHGTRNGGWVQGRDYINPAIQPIFDKIANEAWREVVKL